MLKAAACAEYRLAGMGPLDVFGYLTVSTGIACTNASSTIRSWRWLFQVKLASCQCRRLLAFVLWRVSALVRDEAMARPLDDRVTVSFPRALKENKLPISRPRNCQWGWPWTLRYDASHLDLKKLLLAVAWQSESILCGRIKAVLEYA